MGRIGSMAGAVDGLGPDLGLAFTRRREAAVRGPTSRIRDPSVAPFTPEATGRGGHCRQGLRSRGGDQSDCLVASSGVSTGRLPGGGDLLPALLPWALRRVRDAPPGPIRRHRSLLGGERRLLG